MERGDLGDYPQGFFHIKDPPAPSLSTEFRSFLPVILPLASPR